MNNFANTLRINTFFNQLRTAILNNELHFYTEKFKNLEQILLFLMEHQIIRGYESYNKKEFKVFLMFCPTIHTTSDEMDYYSRPGNKKFVQVKTLNEMKKKNHLNHLGFVRTRLGFITLKTCLQLKIGGEMLVLLV